MIALIDYGAGNLHSVQNALEHIGCEICVTNRPEAVLAADAAILPGVGSFGHAMDCINQSKLVQPVLDFIKSGKPFLGICLGLQMLFEESEESPGVKGLGVFEGKIKMIPGGLNLKVPHVGWNSLTIMQKNGLFQNIAPDPYVYFVHSYYLKATDRSIVSATASYGVELDVAIHKDHVHAVQFHPEKSGEKGIKMLQNFVSFIQ